MRSEELENVTSQIFVFDDGLETLGDERAIDLDLRHPFIGKRVKNVLEQCRHHSVKTTSTDVFHSVVHMRRDARNLSDAVFSEGERRVFSFHQRSVLPSESIFGLGHDPDEISFGERLELHSNRESSLKLRDQITWLRYMERTRCNEENVIGFHHPIFRLNVRAFYYRKQIALHAFPGNDGTASRTSLTCDLVDHVEKDHAKLLHSLERIGGDVLVVDELVHLLLEKNTSRFGDFHRALLGALRQHLLKHV